jgi:anti-anti-sigma factor
MNINKAQNGDKTTLVLSGRLDTTTAPMLQDSLIPEFDTVKHVTLDFAELVYVSSAGLRVLLMGEKAAKSKDASMTLTGVSEEIMEVFEMTGFADMLTIE